MKEDWLQEYRFQNDIEIMQLEQRMKQQQIQKGFDMQQENLYAQNQVEE